MTWRGHLKTDFRNDFAVSVYLDGRPGARTARCDGEVAGLAEATAMSLMCSCTRHFLHDENGRELPPSRASRNAALAAVVLTSPPGDEASADVVNGRAKRAHRSANARERGDEAAAVDCVFAEQAFQCEM